MGELGEAIRFQVIEHRVEYLGSYDELEDDLELRYSEGYRIVGSPIMEPLSDGGLHFLALMERQSEDEAPKACDCKGPEGAG
jgi:hypothetical protein|tara:strand:+ start:524 stop:769 length:246 start_codon:yes stop_codon:yes gene_type:complete